MIYKKEPRGYLYSRISTNWSITSQKIWCWRVAMHVKVDIVDARVIYVDYLENIQVLLVPTIVRNVTVANVYKPPNSKWSSILMKTFDHPAVYTDDFNSHNLVWGYDCNDA